MVNIRRVLDKDIEEVEELLNQVDMVHHIIRPDLFKIGRKYTRDELYQIFRDETKPIFVAADDEDRALGYAFCILQQHIGDNILTDIKTLYIDDLCVFENQRGQHIGRALYEAAVEYARSIGCYNVTLNVWEGNDSARSFYDAMGMTVQKTCMEKIL